jgi:hypothetical protein
MIPSDIFITTQFYREQIDLASSFCQTEPDIPFTSYSVYVFNSRLEPFLKKYFDQTHRKKYNYDQYVFRDIPHEGRMITTLALIDAFSNIILLTSQEIRDINNEISQFTVLHPEYLLFLSDSDLSYPQAWTRIIFPSLQFNRMEYVASGNDSYSIPTIYSNGCIYLDLSQDPSYDSTIKKLYTQTLEKLEDYYNNGTIPNIRELTENGVTFYTRTPGDFLQIEGRTGEQVLDEMAQLPISEIPKSDYQFTIPKTNMNDLDSTVFVVNYASVDMNLEFLETQLGVEFLVSLKKFLEADEIITKKYSPGYYEIVAKKDGKFIQSNLDVKEMFGYCYFTDSPLGLMVLDDMDMLDDSKAVYDSASGKGAIFVPFEKLGDVVQVDYLNTFLINKMEYYDCYSSKTKDIENTLNRLGLQIESKIDDYLFVKKNRWMTKEIVYRGLIENDPRILLAGNWNFQEMSSDEILSIGQKLMTQMNNQGILEEGPFDTIIVPVSSLYFINKFSMMLEEKINQRYKSARKF